MSYTNIIINGLKMPIEEKTTIKDLIMSLFDLRCEFLINKNSKFIPTNRYATCKIKDNDILQVITYSKEIYRLKKRAIFKPNESEK